MEFYGRQTQQKKLRTLFRRDSIRQVQKCGLDCYRFGFFSRSGFSAPAADDLLFYSLDMLYNEREPV